MKQQRITAAELDKKFDDGEDMTAYLDLSKTRRPNQEGGLLGPQVQEQGALGAPSTAASRKSPGMTPPPRQARAKSAPG